MIHFSQNIYNTITEVANIKVIKPLMAHHWLNE